MTPFFDQWVRLFISRSIFMNEIFLKSREVGGSNAREAERLEDSIC